MGVCEGNQFRKFKEYLDLRVMFEYNELCSRDGSNHGEGEGGRREHDYRTIYCGHRIL